jgi:cell wall-associated NlpC family hydrolase
MSPLLRSTVRTLLLATLPVLLGACTLAGGMPATPAPPATSAAGPVPAADAQPGASTASHTHEPAAGPSAAVAAQVVDVALASIGTPYEWGGTDANGFDCSGLIQFAYARLGIQLPRTSAAQMRVGWSVPADRARLRPGDVLGFSNGRSGKTDHVGLYVGAGEFIHSSSNGVRVSSLGNPYWRESLVEARRIVD